MNQPVIRFDDGAAYEHMMGMWSRIAGEIFLDWLAPPPGLRWIDIGCGNGAFTELLVQRCAPAEVQGVDPSDGQLAYARSRAGAHPANFVKGDAMTLPFPERSFDAAVMALVIAFVPEPRKGVAEMVRVIGPGGIAATYMWDMLGGGFPLDPVLIELRAMGLSPTRPPRMEAARMETLREMWIGAGLENVETREITVQRTFADFDDFWSSCAKAPATAPLLAAMSAADLADLKDRVSARAPADSAGRIVRTARANAVKGRLPK
jgi:ubiquinone/menaquinone biosynthesis C-methylase UbiE